MTDKTQMVLQAAAGKHILKATDRQMIIHYVDKNWRSILIGSLSGCSEIELAERAMGLWREG